MIQRRDHACEKRYQIDFGLEPIGDLGHAKAEAGRPPPIDQAALLEPLEIGLPDGLIFRCEWSVLTFPAGLAWVERSLPGNPWFATKDSSPLTPQVGVFAIFVGGGHPHGHDERRDQQCRLQHDGPPGGPFEHDRPPLNDKGARRLALVAVYFNRHRSQSRC
jgi:hypothetical protein